MSDQGRPFEPKDLIWHLPELIAGNEPVLDDPAAQRMLREDPAARAAIHAVGSAVAVMRGGVRARGLPLPRRWEPQGEQLIRFFRERTATLLFNSAAGHVAEATAESVYVDTLWGKGRSAPGSKWLLTRIDELRDVLELSAADPSCSVARRAVLDQDSRGGLHVARSLMTSASQLVPARPAIDFGLAFCTHHLADGPAVVGWNRFVARHASDQLRGMALEWLSQEHVRRGELDSALTALEAAAQGAGRLTLGLTELLVGLLTTNSKTCRRGVARLVDSCTSDLPGLVVQLHWKTDSPWKKIPRRAGYLLKDSLSQLPPELAERVQEEVGPDET